MLSCNLDVMLWLTIFEIVAFDNRIKQLYIAHDERRLPCFRLSVTGGSFLVSADEATTMLPDRLMVLVDTAAVLGGGRGIPFTLEAGYVAGRAADCCVDTSDSSSIHSREKQCQVSSGTAMHIKWTKYSNDWVSSHHFTRTRIWRASLLGTQLSLTQFIIIMYNIVIQNCSLLLLLLVCVSLTITGQPQNSVFIRRV